MAYLTQEQMLQKTVERAESAERAAATAQKEATAAKSRLAELERTPQHKGFVPGHPAHATTGAVYQDSKPFSITNALINGVVGKNPDGAKFEMGVLGRLQKAIRTAKSLPPGANPSAVWLPTNWDHLGHEVMDTEDAKYCKAVIDASPTNYDPDEAAWLVRKGVIYKTQSGYTDNTGGTLVAPPTMGGVIPLIRPQAALIAAGATTMPLPPQGRHTEPRVTGAPSVQAVAESQDAPESDLSTDQIELTAKKIAGMARITEEAVAFTSGTIDAITKAELDRSLGLKMDAYGFYGIGGTSIPAGLLSAAYSSAVVNVETAFPTARGVGTNGNRLLPEYGDLLPVQIEERSFGQDANKGAWVMRPTAYASAVARRADAVTAGDGSGPLVDILRGFADAAPNQWRGRKVVKTTNVSGTLTKGAGTNLSDAFFGIWEYCIVATYGAVQFTQGMDGNSFKRGQYLVRGTMFGDVGFRYPSAFLVYRYILGSQDQI